MLKGTIPKNNQSRIQRKQAEHISQMKEKRYQSLVLAGGQMVWITDPEGRVIEDSPGWRAYTGQTWEEYQGWGWMSCLHPDERENIIKVWRRAFEAKNV